MSGMLELGIAAVLLLACVGAWGVLLQRRRRTGSLVPYEPRRPVPWGLAVLGLLVFLMWLQVPVMQAVELRVTADSNVAAQIQALPKETPPWAVPDYSRPMFQAAAAVKTVYAAVVVLVLVIVYRANRDDFGLSPRNIAGDLLLGVLGFFALAVPALLLQGFLQAVLAESQHPIVLAFKSASDWRVFLWSMVAAVIVAPIEEELLFRGVLQGLFERMYHEREELLTQDVATSPEPNPRPSAVPIFISSAIFALMHLSSGIDVVPLFFLALGLGYLYRQTHRLWACMVVHMLLNGFTMCMLFLQMK